MLIDHLVEHCDYTYRQHIGDRQCDECNHPTACKEDCKDCLDEVHWMRPGGRLDYDCEHLLSFYTCRYSHKYCSEMLYALDEIDLDKYPCYDILSLGCGATPDLMAFDCINQKANKEMRYRGYDRNRLWKPIHDEIERYAEAEHDDWDVLLRRKDVFDILTRGKALPDFNVLIIQYLLSHLYNTRQISEIDDLYDGIVKNVIAHKRPDSPFLLIINDIDSHHKGRDHFWPLQKKLKAAGYRGEVSARCFKPELYLEKSKQHPYDFNKFAIPEPIKEQYKCAIECTSAQLIMEVR